ncbi:uncharacterized protein BDZ99DRAFT_572715 [Mytilinidion resinicola]|uniref:Mid2 domain-containing protein n=1 Tax=Mytilinidion resinicola TaxID=574789 RepID=A0A6A6YGF1_9PEZI|nr:uncharacterized protein BDZ99DRAFT_572715 [Mytilinidion resinicola]KAF2807820.1 hypothetical protein BDZ99DRAFT_572715 [Mytilinidion resinicola]
MTHLEQLLAVAALVTGVTCITFAGPIATPLVPQRLIDGWSPKPTQGPSPNELRKRQFDSSETCGWVDGDFSSQIGCSVGATCMLLTDISPGMAGCCSAFDFQNCGYVNTCMDYSSMMGGACDSDCMSNTFIMKCTDNISPYCVSWTYISDNVQDYGCGTESLSIFETIQQDVTDAANFITTSLSLPYVGANIVTGYQSTATAAAITTTKTAKASRTSLDATDTTNLFSTATAAPSTSSTTTKVPIGLIAGVAGGAFFLLLAIASLIIFFCLRRKQKRAAASNAAALAAATASRPQSQYYPNNTRPQSLYQPMQQTPNLPPPMPAAPEGYSYLGQPNQPYNPESKFATQTVSPVSAPQTPAPAYAAPVGFQTPGAGGYAPLPAASPGALPRGVVEVDATSRPHLAQGGGPIYEIGGGK